MKKEPKEFKYNRNKIPRNPGCYLFFDAKDILLYIGKAKNLQSRVSSYFQKTAKSQRKEIMVRKIAKIETRIVNSEMEALILENNLIKEFMPRFNVLLRDDKNFLYLRVTKEDFPRIEVTRRIVRDGSFYVGPKTSAKKFRETVKFCQKVFQVRTCRVGIKSVDSPLRKGARGISKSNVEITSNPERLKLPCMDYHLKRCSGPCDGLISREKYGEQVSLMKKFLRGDTKEVIKGLTDKMMFFAAEKKFEAAGKIRDLIKSIEISTEKQRVQFSDQISRDFVNFYRDKNNVYFVRLSFRQGRFIDQNEVKFKAGEFLEDSEVWEKVLLQFYEKVDENPAKILLPIEPENKEQLEEVLKVSIIVPQKGDNMRVLEMAQKSAKNFAGKSRIDAMAQEEIFAQALPRLAEKLGLKNPPRRMECYDISHLSGTHTVASQVVFIDGKPKNSEYRRFKIKTLKSGEIDDFAAMREVLERRFRGISEKKPAKTSAKIKLISLKTKKQWAMFHEICKKEIFEIYHPDIDYNEDHKDFKKEKNHFFLLELDKKIIGILRFDEKGKTRLILRTFALTKKFQRQGFGSQILKNLESHAQENGKSSIVLNANLSASGFYEKSDFSRNFWKGDSKFEDRIPMGKKVSKPKPEIPRNPDLIVIDGGKGQLSAVLNVLKNMPNIPLDIETQVVALAKREEEVFRGKFAGNGEIIFEELNIDINSAESKLLQRIRDEAHRFAISFNRSLREKSAKKSRLDTIRGIGPKTKKELLLKFSSPSGIRNASDKELLEVLNAKQLENLRKNL